MKKLISVFLSLALLLAGSLAAAETLGAMKAQTTPEDIKAAMGDPAFEMEITEGALDLEYTDVDFAGTKANAGFVFLNNKLTMAGFFGFENMTSENLGDMKNILSAQYGAAADVAPETIAHLFTTISGAQTPFIFSDASGWTADEQTEVWAFLVSQDGNSQIYVVFVDRDYLASIGTETSAPQGETEPVDLAALEGTWKLVDIRNDSISEEELKQTRDMLESGALVQTYTFQEGRITAFMSMPAFNMEETMTGTYQISGNTLLVTEDGETESEGGVEFSLDGDTLELSTPEGIMVLARQ